MYQCFPWSIDDNASPNARTRGGLVQNKHAGALEDGARDGEPLPICLCAKCRAGLIQINPSSISHPLTPTPNKQTAAHVPLPPTEGHAALPNNGVEPLGEALDELEGVGLPRRLAHLRLWRVIVLCCVVGFWCV